MGHASMIGYAAGAVLAALLATAAMQFLLVTTQRPRWFLGVACAGHHGPAPPGVDSGAAGPAGHRDGHPCPGAGHHRSDPQQRRRQPALRRFSAAVGNP